MLEQHDTGSPLFRSILEGAPAEPGPRATADGAAGEPGPRRNPIDGIASAISLGISLLEGLTTPSSPLDRARAKVAAIRQQEEAAVLSTELSEQKLRDDFTRFALTAVREAQAEQDRKRDLAYEERDRGRSRELER